MQTLVGTISADGSTALFAINPGETLFVSGTVAGGDAFVGQVLIERTANNQTFETARDGDGVAQVYTGTAEEPLEGDALAAVVRNETTKKQFYRVTVSGYDGDAIDYYLEALAGDLTGVVLRGLKGQPILYSRDDGGVQFAGPVGAPSLDSGYVDGEAQKPNLALFPSDVEAAEAITSNGETATAASKDIFGTNITSGASQGSEEVTLEDALTPGHRKLLTFAAQADPGDVINVTGTLADVDAAPLDTLTLDAEGGFVLLEWNGLAWQALYAGDATLTPSE